jgi:MoaA/NifB/PqqE/SkfB family radical SAM enzyme
VPHSRISSQIRKHRILNEVTLELTYQCNLDCFFCYNDRDKRGQKLSLEQYSNLLQDLAGMQTMFLMLTGGEPMVHPHFFQIGSIARELGFVTRIRTNGHSLSRRMAERLRDEVDPYVVEVSLHGATAEVHDRQTRVPGSFDRLVSNIATAKETGLNVRVVSTPTLWNEHQIDAMFLLCDSLQVPLRFQGPVAPRDNGDTTPLEIQPAESTWDLVSEQIRNRRSNPDSDRVSVRAEIIENEPTTCGVGTVAVDIDPYGNVLACMHLQESAGSLHDKSIKDIWENSPLFTRARNRAIAASRQFVGVPVKQLGAPLFCLAVEENLNKGHANSCGSACGQRES